MSAPPSLRASVIVPAYDAEATLADCLRSVAAQSLPDDQYETIVVDDGSRDRTSAIAARFDVRLARQSNAGAASARNTGLRLARAPWIAFIDADCVASRRWLETLLRAAAEEPRATGVAGKTLGYRSDSPAARFVDLTGALDAGRHLSHPRFPFAPSGNVLYRRESLLAIGGYEERYRSYEACDLHQRLAANSEGECRFEPRALVFHRHRVTWREYWRQQVSYGGGLAQFMRSRFGVLRWSAWDELRAWGGVALLGARALAPGGGDELLVRRGSFVKGLAQRIGFDRVYWSREERARW